MTKMSDFQQDLQDAISRAIEANPTWTEEDVADSEEVAEVLTRYTRPVPVSSPSVKSRAEDWAAKLLTAD